MDNQRYFVDTTDTGYIIKDTERTLPLPFNFISKQYADEACAEFNRGGARKVAEYYYVHKIAGNGDNLSFDKFMEENGNMFDSR